MPDTALSNFSLISDREAWIRVYCSALTMMIKNVQSEDTIDRIAQFYADRALTALKIKGL